MSISKSSLSTLVVNGYAGSMTIGASAVGLPIIGSYEDAGFGLAVQRANFPDLDYRETSDQWPAQSLHNTIVLAHPPCAAFSSQTPARRKGTGSGAFACTKQVLDYAMRGKATAIAVESVQPALEGARAIHDAYAKQHGYHLYRVLQNAVSFGVPQWRPRFWAVFVKHGATDSSAMYWKVPTPARYTTVRDVLDDTEPGPVLPAVQRHFDKQMAALRQRAGFSDARLKALLAAHVGRLHSVLAAVLDGPAADCRERYCTPRGHDSWVLRLLDPDGFAPTLLLDSHWTYGGRPVSIAEYNALMGFPRDYVFPEKTLRDQRKYLSKGVCPPVAAWVLRALISHLRGESPTHGSVLVGPGGTANFNLKQKDVRCSNDSTAAA